MTDLDRLKAAEFEEGDSPPDTEAAPVPLMLVDVKPDISPLLLVEKAIEKGMDPNAILDFIERIRKTEAAEKFAAALAGFQGKCRQILKERAVNRKGENGKDGSTLYKFASYDDIKKAIAPLQREFGIVTTFTASPTMANGLLVGTIRVQVGSHYQDTTLPIPIPQGMNTNKAQEYGMAVKYLQRYLLCMALDIVTTDEDDDGASLGEFVTAEEEGALRELMIKTNTEEARFLKWAQAESLDKVLRSKFAAAITMLGKKVGK